jgi:hypothetical protein
MNDVMIDIEAMGQKPGCAIFELAAVKFDLHTGATGAEFLAKIEPSHGIHEPDTVAWHREQGTYPMPGRAAQEDVTAAFYRFDAWLSAIGPVERVWSWGATYDFPVLQAIWTGNGPTPDLPWKYHQALCARTVWKLAFGDLRHADRPHKAVEDCRAAVADLARAYQTLREGRAV